MGKKATIQDVAREAGVSPTLVSFVLNGTNRVGEKTRARVLEVAGRLGYRKADSPAPSEWPAARLIGVVVPDLEERAGWMDQLSRSAYRLGYTLQFASAGEDPVRFCHLVRAFSATTKGLVLAAPPQDEDCDAALAQLDKPYVIPEDETPDKTIKKLIEKI